MVGEWVFGCDICQEVCPWNARAKGACHPELEPPAGRRELDLAGLLALPREEYVERFRGSPMKRAKLEGLQRNAAVAMGNRGDERYVEPLGRALAGETAAPPVVRGHAAWALGRIGGEAALRHLWARHRIRSLSDQEALQGGDAQREAITALGLRYGLLTQYTSFIAIDRVVRNPSAAPTPIDQPSPMPAGVSNLAIGAEVPSTPEPSGWLALGVVLVLLAAAAWHRGGSSAKRLWRKPAPRRLLR